MNLKNFTSCSFFSRRLHQSVVTTLKPRSGNEYQKVDRISLLEADAKVSVFFLLIFGKIGPREHILIFSFSRNFLRTFPKRSQNFLILFKKLLIFPQNQLQLLYSFPVFHIFSRKLYLESCHKLFQKTPFVSSEICVKFLLIISLYSF